MMKACALAILIAGWLGVLSSTASASPYTDLLKAKEEVRLARIKADPRYQQTLQLCQNNLREYGWVAKESAAEVMQLGFLYAPAWSRFFENRGISPDVKNLLDSEAFQRGLQDCDPNLRVIPKIATADYVGKFVGIAATGLAWRFAGPAIARLSAMGRAGSIAHKVLLLSSIGYVVLQGMDIAKTVANRETTKREVKELVDSKTNALQSNISRLHGEVENDYRVELQRIERELQRSDLPEPQRQRMQAKAERIRLILKS